MKCCMFTPAHKQSNAQPVSKQQAPCKRTPLSPSVSIALCCKVWAIPLATFGQLFQLCRFPASFPSTAFLKCGGKTKSWLCKQCSATDERWYVISSVLVSDPKQSSIQAAVKKLEHGS